MKIKILLSYIDWNSIEVEMLKIGELNAYEQW